MSTDKSWNNIYNSGMQLNKYPFDWVVSQTKKYFSNSKGFSVLDLGCGFGNHVSFFLKSGFESVTAVDGSDVAINFVKKKFKKSKRVNFIKANFNNIEFKKNSYDLCLDRMSITHNNFNNSRRIVSNIYKCLKKDAYFFSVCFSKKHSEYKKKTKSKDYFSSIVEKGIRTNFLNQNDIKKIYKNFEFISIVHETKEDVINKNISCWWYLVLKKN